MGVTNKLFQARFFLRSPIARLWLALRFDDVPTVVPPAMIIVGRIRRQHFGRRGGVFRIGAHGSEYQELSAFGDLIVEDGFLRVGLACQDKNWTNLESFHLVDGTGAMRLPVVAGIRGVGSEETASTWAESNRRGLQQRWQAK